MTTRSGAAVVLVHGGLYEPMDAARFWAIPGIVGDLTAAGLAVHAPDRPSLAKSWQEEGDALATGIDRHGLAPVPLVAGSNGCSAALRAAVDHPHLVSALLLCWPATAGDPRVDEKQRLAIEQYADSEVADRLLAGETIRGVTDEELSALQLPVALLPSNPSNPFHQERTVTRLAELLPQARELPGSPESPRPEFDQARDAFVASVLEQLRRWLEPTDRQR